MRFKKLILLTNQLQATQAFYSGLLGLPLVEQTCEQVSFQVGASVLTFQAVVGPHHYHFAFSIPCNQIEEAQVWMAERLDLIPIQDSRTIIRFEDWRASSIYFYDNNRNIVELIARTDLENPSSEAFSSQSILFINEIGIGTRDPLGVFQTIEEMVGFPAYSKGPFREDFIAQGFEDCLFVVSRSSRSWYPTDDAVAIHPVEVVLETDSETFCLSIN